VIRARLGEIELGDLLRTLEGGRKNAVIQLTCPQLTVAFILREGKIAYIQTNPGPHLGEYLVRFDYLTLEQVQQLVKYQQQENPETPPGLSGAATKNGHRGRTKRCITRANPRGPLDHQAANLTPAPLVENVVLRALLSIIFYSCSACVPPKNMVIVRWPQADEVVHDCL